MNIDIYEKLANALDLLPTGYPRTNSGAELQILRKHLSKNTFPPSLVGNKSSSKVTCRLDS